MSGKHKTEEVALLIQTGIVLSIMTARVRDVMRLLQCERGAPRSFLVWNFKKVGDVVSSECATFYDPYGDRLKIVVDLVTFFYPLLRRESAVHLREKAII